MRLNRYCPGPSIAKDACPVRFLLISCLKCAACRHSVSRAVFASNPKSRELEIVTWARRPSAYRSAQSQVLPSPPILAQAQ
ncbi:hypothetical protein M2189_005419 [Bradyrhizobium japonicum]|nr:hypothetical protein [Bradyrhizobium japonicum]MCS3962216.1 hypothetical protein [Bradyrhizobium japonicum]MCS3994533.1 hypothetical protein [Bradyrhizobium japonicum]